MLPCHLARSAQGRTASSALSRSLMLRRIDAGPPGDHALARPRRPGEAAAVQAYSFPCPSPDRSVRLHRLMIAAALTLAFATTTPGRSAADEPAAAEAPATARVDHPDHNGSAADYRRSEQVSRLLRNRVFRDRVEPNWFDDGDRFWYRLATGPGRHRFVLVDAAAGLRADAFDHASMARAIDALGERRGRTADPERLPVDDLLFDDPGVPDQPSHLLLRGQWWRWLPDEGRLEAVDAADGDAGGGGFGRKLEPEPRRAGQRSDGGGGASRVEFANQSRETLEIYWRTTEGEARHYFQLAPGEVRAQNTYRGHLWEVRATGEPARRLRFRAAPLPARVVIDDDSWRAAVEDERADDAPAADRRRTASRWRAEIRDHNIVLQAAGRGRDRSGEQLELTTDGAPDDRYQGPLLWSPDGRHLAATRVVPADTRRIHLIESAPRDQLQPRLHELRYRKPGDDIEVPRVRLFDTEGMEPVDLDDDLIPNPWSLTRLEWSPDGRWFTWLYNRRGHQQLRWIAVEPATGEARVVIDENSPTFIDYAHKTFLHPLWSAGTVLWMSERDGWNHLYEIEIETGEVRRQLTSGEWLVRRVERVDEERGELWLTIMGWHDGQDPYHEHLARLDLADGGLTVITHGDGTHEWEFSPDDRFVLTRWSRVDQPPVTELRCARGGDLVVELERADWQPLLDTGWQPPLRFVAKGRDGGTDIHGIIVRPMNMEPGRAYPVLELIYAGPQGYFVPKAFSTHAGLQRMAELGFIMVRIDGMGTNWRGKAFHDVAWRNLGDSGFPDRIAWLQAAAAEHPEMDLSRVGIYGGSAGGQSALRALLAHGDSYHAAAADCGCHDNRMDKIWWNELWMGWPVGRHYHEQSNVTQAHRLQGKLLLTVGELDRNVDPASTMQVVDALIRADKDFDLLIVPGGGHGVGESPYAARRRADFFVRHLIGTEPRH